MNNMNVDCGDCKVRGRRTGMGRTTLTSGMPQSVRVRGKSIADQADFRLIALMDILNGTEWKGTQWDGT